MNNEQRALELLKSNDIEGIRLLFEQDPSTADLRDSSGVSLLMQVIYRGQHDLADAMANKKRELDIFEAASLGRLDRLKELVPSRSLTNSFSKDGFTALHFASYFGQPGAAKLLIENGAKVDAIATNPTQVMPLHSAASARNFDAARLLLEHGAPVDARQQLGWTPLHAAAQNGDRKMIDLLLKHGADKSLKNDQGKSAAMVAREKGHDEIASLLEAQG
jgi:uncharacterized protein